MLRYIGSVRAFVSGVCDCELDFSFHPHALAFEISATSAYFIILATFLPASPQKYSVSHNNNEIHLGNGRCDQRRWERRHSQLFWNIVKLLWHRRDFH